MASRPSPIVALLFVALLPAGCGSKSPTAPTPAADFSSQFDSLWTTFDREYSYFDHKRIDWNAMRSTYRPRALAAADQTAFIAIIREMLGQLHDIHVVLRDPSGATIPTYEPDRVVNWNRSVWQQYIARANWASWSSDSGFGVLDGVPYVTLGGWNTNSIRIADFDAALERFRTAPAIVIDVRMNGGGTDSIAFEVAGRFASASLVTGYVKTRSGPAHSDFSAPVTRTLNPRGAWQFGGKVIVLIGKLCASSNESFIYAMGRLPNVTLAGDRTIGASANPGSFNLANGWTYTVSRWIEYTADNDVIEDNGIAPDEFVPVSAGDFAQGRDPVIDFALARARQ